MAAIPNQALALPWAGPIVREVGGALEVLAMPPPALATPMEAVFVAVRRAESVFTRAGFEWDAEPKPEADTDRQAWYAYPFEVPSEFPAGAEVLMFLRFDQAASAVVDPVAEIRVPTVTGPPPPPPPPLTGKSARRGERTPKRATSPQQVFAATAADASSDGTGQRAGSAGGDIHLCGDRVELLSRGLVSFPRTVPQPRALKEAPQRIVFDFASCRYPPGILDRTPTAWTPPRPAGAGDRVMKTLFDRVSEAGPDDRPTLLLLVGDQIYVDATRGLFDPVVASDPFRQSYGAFFHAQFVQETLSRFQRVEMMLDDHEIRDNWEPIKNESRRRIARDLHTAVSDYNLFERFGLHAKIGPRLQLDFPIVAAPAVFFVADTRTEREARTATTFERAQIMSRGQRRRLRRWLCENREAPLKFVACPSMLLPRRVAVHTRPDSALHADAWDGYPASRASLLRCLLKRGIDNVIFLSGDEHIPSIACIELKAADRTIVAYSIHSSAIYAPFPFANSRVDDFLADDDFWICNGDIHVVVKTCFPVVGDHFVELDATAEKVNVLFKGTSEARFVIDLATRTVNRLS